MWAKIAELLIFGIIFPKGVYPLSDFHQIWLGEGVPGLHPHAKFHLCGLKAAKIAKIGIFGINLPICLCDFYYICREKGIRTLVLNLIVVV